MSLVFPEALLIPADIDSYIKYPQEEAMFQEELRQILNDIPVSRVPYK